MDIDKEGIEKEAQNCSEKVRDIVDRHIDLSMTQQKYRNMLQIVLQDEISEMDIDIDSITYFQTFASLYDKCETVEQIKKELFDILKDL